MSDWSDSVMAAVGSWGSWLLYVFVAAFLIAALNALQQHRARQRHEANKRQEKQASLRHDA